MFVYLKLPRSPRQGRSCPYVRMYVSIEVYLFVYTIVLYLLLVGGVGLYD